MELSYLMRKRSDGKKEQRQKCYAFLLFTLLILTPVLGFEGSISTSLIIDKESIFIQQSISGTITDSQNNPLPGASVLVKGTTNGVVSDFDGKFSISVADSANAVLVISYIGFKPLEVPVSGRTNINVQLEESTISLDDVVVIGYGTSKKSDLTGSVSSIREDDFNPGTNVSVDQLILGKAAGVNITQTSGEPGAGVSVRIRGASSINASSDPLYVIDGFPIDNSASFVGDNPSGLAVNSSPRNPLNALNPNDIQSIEVLKDASATAIYGSRGANGVILITTKKGKSGDIKVNYNTQVGVQTIANRIDVLSAREYITAMNELAQAAGSTVPFDSNAISAIGAGTDWQDEVFRSALLNVHNISVSGGNEKTNFFVSGNYFDQEGIVLNSGIEKFIGRVNIETKLSDKFKLGVNLNTSLVKDQNSVDGLNNNESAGPINAALLYDPTEPIFDASGNFAQSEFLTVNNPLAVANGATNKAQTNRTLANVYLDYIITDGLTAKLNLGSDRESIRRDVFNSSITLTGQAFGGLATINNLSRSSSLVEFTMNYDKSINENNSFNILGGITFQEFNVMSSTSSIGGFPSDFISTNNLGLGNIATAGLGSNTEKNTLLSYLGRVNYNLYNKLLLTGSFRVDGSSRFGANNKYGFFPSFAAAYKLSEEDFIPDFFNSLKLRASWGETGNQEIGNFNSLLTFGTGRPAVIGEQVVPSSEPTRIGNPNIKWETTEQLNVGIDYSILNSRLSGSVDYFVKTTTDQLVNVPLPVSSGFASVLTNLGELQNRGFEFLLNSNNITTPTFNWSTSLNFTTLTNEVTDLGGFGPILSGSVQDVGNTSIAEVGESLGSYFGFNVVGFFDEGTDFSQTAQPAGRPGDPIFEDVNGDGVITPDDRVILGNSIPGFTFGLTNSFAYKNFDFSFFFQGQMDVDMININAIESLYPNNFRRNRFREHILDRWTPQNPNASFPSSVNPGGYGASKVTSLVVEDASFVRLRNVQLGYNVSVDNFRFIDSLRISLTGENLFTITDYSGFDPEVNSFGRGNARVDYSSYPAARTIILGLNIGL